MERFDLAPWELAPDSPEKLEGVADARIQANWFGDEQEFLLREVEVSKNQFVIFVREMNSMNEGNWMLHFFGSPALPCWPKRILHIEQQSDEPIWQQGEYWPVRLFYLQLHIDGEAQWVQIISEIGGGNFLFLNGHIERSVPFLYGDGYQPQEFIKRSGEQEKERFLLNFNTPNSDFNFALMWRQLSIEKREEQTLICERGSSSELLHLMRCVLRCFPQLVKDDDLLTWEFSIPRENDGSISFPNEPSFLQQWRLTLMNWFQPSKNWQLQEKYPCTIDSFGMGNAFSVSIELPTQHEHLEAALELREWARGKVPDELLQTLM